MHDFLHRTWAQIDLDALQSNYRAVCDRLSPGCLGMAILKADAYGHGAVQAAKALLAAGADRFGVSNIEEALQLRRGGITTPILILSYTPPTLASVLAEHDLTQAVLDADYADALEQAAAAAAATVRVHIKLDTGMSRVGFFCQGDAPIDAIARVCALPHLEAEGIFTHFPVADEHAGDDTTRLAFARFTEALAQLQARGITFACRHCCNSAAALRFPEMHLDMARIGVVLYGAAPSPEMEGEAPLRPVMTLKTAISQIKTVPAGTAVSYGHTYRTARPTVLATLPIGYADGLQRLASGAFSVTVNGHAAPIAGRVCMDQCLVDVTDIPDVACGDSVTVFGDGGHSAADYAAACRTIPYESLCLIGKRVPRVFVQHGEVVAVSDLLHP